MPEVVEKQVQRPDGKKYMLVRYGRMKNLGLFEHHEAHIPKCPTQVVVKTNKGLEIGKVVGQLTCYKGGRFRWSPEQIGEYYKTSEIDALCDPVGKFIRYASPDDISDAHHFQKLCRDEIRTCGQLAKDLGLDMKVVDAEHILGGERIIFYFLAEGRIDFRQLVKNLSHELQTRIEMRQIGARDEAKLLGDVESCGQECCCRRFLQYLKPVNMRMAKMQKATLDPAKISGYCGRLKCCLRYEDKTYGELKKKLPHKNTIVKSEKGEGRVLNGQILTQLVLVEYDNGDRETVPLEELEIIGPGGPRPKRESPDTDKEPERPRRGRGRPPEAREGGRPSNNRSDRRPSLPVTPAHEDPQGKPASEVPTVEGESQTKESSDSADKPKSRRRRRSGGRSGRRRGRGRSGNADQDNNNGGDNQPTAEKVSPAPKPSGDA